MRATHESQGLFIHEGEINVTLHYCPSFTFISTCTCEDAIMASDVVLEKVGGR